MLLYGHYRIAGSELAHPERPNMNEERLGHDLLIFEVAGMIGRAQVSREAALQLPAPSP
jgi:hypothetical protein